jgi:predicted dehydrogenase
VFTPAEVHGLRALHEAHPNLTIQVGLQRRYSSFYQTAKDMIDKGVIGKVTHVFAQWHRNTNWRRSVKDPSMEEQLNWRLYKKYSGGLAAELMSHQVDVADWMFGSKPQSVMGVGGIDYWKDGRDIYDNIQLVFEYPAGQKLLYSAVGTNRHLMGRRIPGDGCRELIMGTDGAIEITLIPYGEGMWFLDPMRVKMGEEETQGEQWVAGATVADMLEQGEGLPIVPGIKDLNSPDVGFIEREVEFAKRWLYQKGIMSPAEDRDPEYKELESFLIDVRDGGKPKSDLEVGLNDSIAVMLANLCMDQQRKIQFSEIEQMGADGVQMTEAARTTNAAGD